jgi:ABC-2 type transport system permease protein
VTAALRAEWRRTAALRSSWWVLAAYVTAVVGIGAGVTAALGRAQAATPGYDPAGDLAFYGINFGHVAVITFAVLRSAGEWSRRTAATSLVAVPRRGAFLAAKLAVTTGLVLAAGAVSAAAALAATQAQLGPAAVTLGTPGVLRATVAAALYPALLAVVCTAAGVVLRDQGAALGLLVPFFFLVSPLLELVPGLRHVAVWLPDRSGEIAIRLHSRPLDPFGPLAGLGVLALWAAGAALLAWWDLRRRDV